VGTVLFLIKQYCLYLYLKLDAAQIIFLEQMNTFQMEGRYPDYNFKIYQAFKQPQTALILKQVENIYQWLLNSLP